MEGEAEEMCKWEIGLPEAVLFKAFGRDKLTQEDAPSQKASLTRHTHMQDCGTLTWEVGPQCLLPAPSKTHTEWHLGIQPAQRKDPQSVS